MSEWLLTDGEIAICEFNHADHLGQLERAIALAQLRKVVEKMERLQSMNPLLLRSWQWQEFRKEAGLE